MITVRVGMHPKPSKQEETPREETKPEAKPEPKSAPKK